MPYKITPKIVFLFILFFILTYFEDKDIGGISFAALWKAPIILYLVFYTYIANSKESGKFLFVTIAGLFSIKLLIHSNSLNSIIPEIQYFLKYIIIPVVFFYTVKKYNNKPHIVTKLLFWMAVFLIWNNVPYLFEIVSPKVQKDYSLAFGDDMLDNAGFSGAYLTIHNQAVYMSAACLYLIFLLYKFPEKFNIKTPFIIATLGIGLYCLYLSFARTGWLFFLIGLLIIVMKEFKRKYAGKVVLVMISILAGLALLVSYNDSFRKRVFDERNQGVESQESNLGSGRLVMGAAALSNWWDSDIKSIFIGYGTDMGKDKMYKKIGKRLFAHNIYIEILQTSGLIGIMLLFYWIWSMFQFNRKYACSFSTISFAFLIGWLVVGGVQSFEFVYLNLFIACILALKFIMFNKKNSF